MNTEQVNQIIEKKNVLLLSGAEKLREVGNIAKGLEELSLTTERSTAVQLCRLAGYKLRVLSYAWIDMQDESTVAVAPPTEEETAEAREVVGDD